MEPIFPTKADVVIVGAGVAGLFCAWRLLKQNADQTVVVVERLNRAGGRLDSDLIRYGGGEVREEEGGMRFVFSHERLLALFSALGKCGDIVPFLMADATQHNRRFYRGKSFTLKAANDGGNEIWGQLYNLAPAGAVPNERGVAPAQIMADVYAKVLEANGYDRPPDGPTPAFWQKLRLKFEWEGTKLNQWQLGGLLSAMGYTQECVTMLTQTLGFQAPLLNMSNAGVAIQLLMDFPEDPAFYTAKMGFSAVTSALQSEVEKLGGRIIFEAELTSIKRKGDGFALTSGPAAQDQTGTGFGVSVATTTTPQVILAISSGPLKTLYMRSSALHDHPKTQQLITDLRSVLGLSLLKINLYYEHAWWEDDSRPAPAFQNGPSFADLALGSVYPFGSVEGTKGAKGPAALTIYCDFAKIDLWRGMQNIGPMFDSPLQREHSKAPQTIFPASQAVVHEVTRQLELLFDEKGIPEPVMTSYRLWTDESDYGAAYHQWRIDADDSKIISRLMRPMPGLYVVGEAYSDQQCWVEGALRSAELALEDMGVQSILLDGLTPCAVPLHPAS